MEKGKDTKLESGKGGTLRTAPGLTLLRTLHRMRPLRSERQNSSSEGVGESDEDAKWSIWRSHSVALYLLEASTIQQQTPNHFHYNKQLITNIIVLIADNKEQWCNKSI